MNALASNTRGRFIFQVEITSELQQRRSVAVCSGGYDCRNFKEAEAATERRNYSAECARYKASNFDIDPRVLGAGIGDGLDDAHITHAHFEVGLRFDPAL